MGFTLRKIEATPATETKIEWVDDGEDGEGEEEVRTCKSKGRPRPELYLALGEFAGVVAGMLHHEVNTYHLGVSGVALSHDKKLGLVIQIKCWKYWDHDPFEWEFKTAVVPVAMIREQFPLIDGLLLRLQREAEAFVLRRRAQLDLFRDDAVVGRIVDEAVRQARARGMDVSVGDAANGAAPEDPPPDGDDHDAAEAAADGEEREYFRQLAADDDEDPGPPESPAAGEDTEPLAEPQTSGQDAAP